MTKKQTMLYIGVFLLGMLVTYLSFFTVDEIGGYAPSYTAPLTDEEFAEAQKDGKATFNGSPTTIEGNPQSIDMVINCRKATGFCIAATTHITKYTLGPSMEQIISYYKISDWSDEGIIKASIEPVPSDCGVYSLEANVRSREVTVIYTSTEGVNKETCTNPGQDGQTKLDFNMAFGSMSFLQGIKMDIHYALGELMN